jgi:competence protein ComEC
MRGEIKGMNVLNFIPGLRSGSRWKTVVAVLYYAIGLVTLTSGLGVFLFFESLPFIAFSLGGIVKKRDRKSIITFIASFAVFCLGLSIAPEANVPVMQTEVTKQAGEKDIKSSNNSTVENSSKDTKSDEKTTSVELPKGTETQASQGASASSGELKVHFIDVGQADSILIEQGNEYMLIDAGNNEDSQLLKNYLSSKGINELKYFIGTHKDEDHIGSGDYIINSFKVGKVYFPRQTATTKTYKDFVSAVSNKGLKLTVPTVGETFKLGEATCTILAPNSSDYEDANDYSIVVKISYGSTSFLFTGDAESVSESEMIAKGLDLSSTVLKVGHHGSRSSTGQGFLNKVNPKYAVISVGKGNSYGHPTQEVMNRLKNKNIPVYRTDESGTIIATSNGTDISFSTKTGSYNGVSDNTSANSSSNTNNSSDSGTTVSPPSSSTSSSTANSGTSTQSPTVPAPQPSIGSKVYWLTTKTSKSYHTDINCTYIKGKTTKSGSIQEAIADAHGDPCDKCAK